MSAQLDARGDDDYDIRVVRTEVCHLVRVAVPSGIAAQHGSFYVPGMYLTISELERMFVSKAALAAWCLDCGRAVPECPTLGKYLLSAPLASVGLEEGMDVVVNDPASSRIVGTIVKYWRNGQWMIRESKHGTTCCHDAQFIMPIK